MFPGANRGMSNGLCRLICAALPFSNRRPEIDACFSNARRGRLRLRRAPRDSGGVELAAAVSLVVNAISISRTCGAPVTLEPVVGKAQGRTYAAPSRRACHCWRFYAMWRGWGIIDTEGNSPNEARQIWQTRQGKTGTHRRRRQDQGSDGYRAGHHGRDARATDAREAAQDQAALASSGEFTRSASGLASPASEISSLSGSISPITRPRRAPRFPPSPSSSTRRHPRSWVRTIRS